MGNNYNLVLNATIDPKSLQASIKAQNDKNVVIIKAQIDPKFKQQFDSVLSDIQAKAKSINLIKFSESGNKAIVDYTNQLNQSVKATITMGKELKISETVTKNLAKEASEMARAYQNAAKFLEKSKGYSPSSKLSDATSTAKGIQNAVIAGNIDEVRKLTSELNIQKTAFTGVAQGVRSWTDGMMQSIKTTAQYALSIGLVYGALNQLREGIQYVKELNKELTNIQLVTGQEDSEIAKLAVDYNDLAKTMGATTIEVAKGSLEFIRQGKSQEETATLLRNSMKLSKLGNIESAESTEKLTAIMNGFKLTAYDTGEVIDKLIALDNSYATSVEEISTAMQYSSNSAQQAGVDFEHLAAYITIVSSTTRQSAETIGQAFKTMFSRFTDIKEGKIDEDGLGINNVEKSLARVNIKLRDSKNDFRDIQDVIQELGEKWESLDEVTQADLAKSIAGVRQKEQFLVLMENQLKIQQAINEENNSQGLADERYEIYLKSIEAAQNKFTATWEEFMSTGATKDMITGFYNAASAGLEFASAIGGISTAITVLLPQLRIGIWALEKWSSYFDKLKNQREGLIANRDEIEKTSISYEEYAEKTKKAYEEQGYFIDETGKAYKQGSGGMKFYNEQLDLLDEKTYDAINTTDAFDRAQGRVESAVTSTGEAILSETGKLQSFSETLKGLADTASTVDELISKSNSADGLTIEDASKIPPEYLNTLTVIGDKLRINIDLLKETQLQEAQTALTAIQSAQQRGDATAQQVAIVQMQYNQLLAESQNAYGAFSQTAWDYDALIWQISNDAVRAGYTAFKDTEGNALTTAQQIHNFMASSSGSFDNFVNQVANATGRTVAEVTNIINQMISNTMANLNALQQAEASRYTGLAGLYGKSPTYNKSTPTLFPSSYTPVSGGYSGGGGGSSSKESKAEQRAREAAERLKAIEDQISSARKNATDDLKDQLGLYKDIIDERKKLLETMADEREYQQDVEDKNKEILKIQSELNALQFDDTEEGTARRLVLQDELNKLNQELEDINYNQSIQTQKNALDADYAAFQSQIENAIRAVEDISATSLSGFAGQLATILQGISMPVPTFHSGAEMGVVGKSGTSLKSNEIFAKMMAGEVVSNPAQIESFMNKTLPQIAQGSSSMNSGNVEINMPVTVAGNLDKSVLPDLKKMVDLAIKQANENMFNRGFTRRADMFGNY